MSEYVIANKNDLTNIANVIRSKNGSTAQLSFPTGMINAISSISNEATEAPSINLQSKNVIPSTSTQTITADNGYDGLSSVTIDAIQVETKTVTPTTTTQTITPTAGKYLNKVSINAIQTETKSITTNGTYTPSSGKYFSSVTVNVPTSDESGITQVYNVNRLNSNCTGVYYNLTTGATTTLSTTNTLVPLGTVIKLTNVYSSPTALQVTGGTTIFSSSKYWVGIVTSAVSVTSVTGSGGSIM